MQIIDIANWKRKDHFLFFSQFEEPFFGVTANVECSVAYSRNKQRGGSFFLYYLHCALRAANAVEAFKYRIRGEQVVRHDRIDASPTIHRPDDTFGFSYMTYDPDPDIFLEAAQRESDRVQAGTGLELAEYRDHIIHFSALPWIHFTSLSHARSFAFKDSVPKISFGKIILDAEGKRWMPVSLHLHHGLADGIDAGKFFSLFQDFLNEK